MVRISNVRFTGGSLSLFGRVVITLLAVVTVVGGPWAVAWLVRWVVSNLRLDDDRLAYTDITGRQFLWIIWIWSIINLSVGQFLENGWPSLAVGLTIVFLQLAFFILGRIIGTIRSSSGHMLVMRFSDWLQVGIIFGWVIGMGLIGFALAGLKHFSLNSRDLGLLTLGILGVFSVMHYLVKGIIESTIVLPFGTSGLFYFYSTKYDGTLIWLWGRLFAFGVASVPIVTVPWSFRWLIKEIVSKIGLNRLDIRRRDVSDGENPEAGGPVSGTWKRRSEISKAEAEESEVRIVSRTPVDSPSIRVARITDPADVEPEQKASPQNKPIAWRKISLLATPVLLAAANLIDAARDLQQATIRGDEQYRSLVGSGKVKAEALVRAAQRAGKFEFEQLLETGEGERLNKVQAANQIAAELRAKGWSESEITRMQAEETRRMIEQFIKKK